MRREFLGLLGVEVPHAAHGRGFLPADPEKTNVRLDGDKPDGCQCRQAPAIDPDLAEELFELQLDRLLLEE